MVAPRRIVLSGCSGGGKSTLLAELSRRGHATVDEPGRRVVKAELAHGGDGVPWLNLTRFMDLALQLAIADFGTAAHSGVTFFDRSVVDTASAMLRHAQQQADLAQWHDQAQDAATAGDWQLAASALDRIVHAEATRSRQSAASSRSTS